MPVPIGECLDSCLVVASGHQLTQQLYKQQLMAHSPYNEPTLLEVYIQYTNVQ